MTHSAEAGQPHPPRRGYADTGAPSAPRGPRRKLGRLKAVAVTPRRLTSLVLVLTLGLAGCAGSREGPDDDTGSPSEEPVVGGVLRVGLFYEPGPIDPLARAGVAERTVAQSIFDSLVSVTPNGELTPGLATEWSSDDGQAWTFKLREGVTFHDGTPFNAEAVEFHFNRLLNPENACASCAEISALESVEVTGEYEVVFHLSTPSAAFPATLVDYPGMIVSPAAVETLGDEFGNSPVGTGPFRWVERVEGEHITLERNPDYWKEGQPYLDSVVFRPIDDVQARFATVQSGDIDIMHEPGISERLQAEAAGLQVLDVGAVGTKFVMFHTQRPPFDDVRARLAVAYATDADTINATLHEGLYRSTTDPFPNGHWADAEPDNYPAYDLDKARELVNELGGLSFEMDVGVTADTQLAQALQAMWAEAGIEVEINTMETATYIDRGLNGEFVSSLFSWSGRWDPDLNTYQFFHSSSDRNYTRLVDAELDNLLEHARAELDQAKRAELYADVAARLAELMPYVYLYSQDKAFIAGNHVKNVPLMADGIIRTDAIWLEQ